MQGWDNFKTGTKETGGNRNVVPLENSTNLVDCKEIKQNRITRSQHNKVTVNRIGKLQATFFGHVMRREKLEVEHLVTTGIIKGNCSRGKQREKMFNGKSGSK